MQISRSILQISLCWASAVILTLAVMFPGLSGGFLFDDNANIVNNTAIQIDTLTLESLKNSTNGLSAGPLGRPISVLSFALTHYYFGLNPFAFKAINLFLHILNGLLLARLVALIVPLLRIQALSEKNQRWLPRWVAAIWMIHPINVLPIMLSVQRMTILAGTFLLLALISHVKAMASTADNKNKWLWLGAGWLVFWPLSVFSKESGLLFPAYVLALATLKISSKPESQKKHFWSTLASLIALLAIAISMIAFLGTGWLDSAYAMRPFSLPERLMTEARVLWLYASQIVIPNPAAFGLYLDDIAISTGFLAPPSTLLAITAGIALITAVILWRKRHPTFGFAVAWFLVGHGLESTFLPLEIAHEHRNYIPSIGLIIAMAYLGLCISQYLKPQNRQKILSITAALAISIFTLMTWGRTVPLGDPLYGPQIEAARHPHSARANYAAALTLIKAGYGDSNDPNGARHIQHYFEQSGLSDHSFKFAHLSRIAWACASGRSVTQEWIDEFAHRLRHTSFGPQDREMPEHLHSALLNAPNCLDKKNALKLFTAGADNPRNGKSLQASFLVTAAHYELKVSNDPKSAKYYLKKAILITPEDRMLQKALMNPPFSFQN